MSWREVGTGKRSLYSEETNSTFDEDRTKRIFHACDANGDGYIDSKDLATICEDLNLDGCIEDLMHELGADKDGKISYEQFLKAQLLLRPKIKAMKDSCDHLHICTSACSANSGGKCDYWEYDSGVRDLNSDQNTLHCLIEDNYGDNGGGTNSENLLQMANKLHLAAIASLQAEKADLLEQLYIVTDERNLLEDYFKQVKINPEHAVVQKYEEQLTELRSVIAVLRRKLDEQYACTIMEEIDAQSDHFKVIVNDQKDEATSPVPVNVQNVGVSASIKDKHDKELEQQNKKQKERINKLTGELKLTKKFLRESYNHINNLETKLQHCENIKLCPKLVDCNCGEKPCSSHCTCGDSQAGIPKVAEKIKVQKLEKNVTGKDIMKLGVSHTEVAEHLVSKVQDDCNAQELSQKERKQIELHAEESRAKEEYLRAQNRLLQANFEEMKNNCERIYLLLGKYESKSVALKIVVDMCYELIGDYEQLVHLLMNHRRRDTPVSKEEKDIRAAIASLRKQWSKLEPTIVELESYQNVDVPGKIKPTNSEKKILDLETAVLIQDLTEMRRQNAKLKITIHEMTHEFEVMEKKVMSLEDKLKVPHSCSSLCPKIDSKICSSLPEKVRDMSTALEKIIHKTDSNKQLSAENTEELKKIAISLMKNFDNYRKNSEHQLYHLEDNILYLMATHAIQINDLLSRITLLEELAEQELNMKSSSDARLVIKSFPTS